MWEGLSSGTLGSRNSLLQSHIAKDLGVLGQFCRDIFRDICRRETADKGVCLFRKGVFGCACADELEWIDTP